MLNEMNYLDDEPCYVISVAARLVNLHPQTLRYYEREGLIEPARSSGNVRLYSTRDIERLRRIVRLTGELGINLAGVEVIVAEGFERIHRTNLVGMGVMPLEFKTGENRETYAIDGTETFDVIGTAAPRCDLILVINRANGERVEVTVTCRLDTAEEVSVYAAGGVLQRFAQDFLESSQA